MSKIDLSKADLSGLNMRGVNLANSTLVDAKLFRTDLGEADRTDTNLTGAMGLSDAEFVKAQTCRTKWKSQVHNEDCLGSLQDLWW